MNLEHPLITNCSSIKFMSPKVTTHELFTVIISL